MEEQVERTIEEKLIKYKEDVLKIATQDYQQEKERLKHIIQDMNQKERKLDELVDQKNELQELQNQLRHAEKKSDAYDIEKYAQTIKRNKMYLRSEEIIKKKMNILSKILVLLDEKERVGILQQILSKVLLGENALQLKEDGILFHLLLEEKYLKKRIENSENQLGKEDFEGLKKKVQTLYEEQYIPMSQKILKQMIRENTSIDLICEILGKIEKIKDSKDLQKQGEPKISKTPILTACKSDILELYPIVLTTVDSVISNYRNYFKNGKKLDYVIIDEASQCDILAALPLLYLAKHIIVVGDCRQLSAIINLNQNQLSYKVEEEFDYIKENFLSTILKATKIKSTMLLEHYRCDYKIINYCNKYFYENQLKIYKDSNPHAISLINVDKGKYVQIEDHSYKNEREIKSIEEQIGSNITGKFIITPFKLQAKALKGKYNDKQCGTIHTFQGKGEKEVYFSSVLNQTEECIRHIKSEQNLFTKQLINVAVSRAKEKFILVTDASFFKKADENMKNLIDYIEIYGDKIPDKTVCIFDYLYKQMPTYTKMIKGIDNPYEEKIYHLLKEYITNRAQYQFTWKLPLAEFVTDKKYLKENPVLKQFILSNSHLDFCIYQDNIKKPILAVELDGKTHEEPLQQKRDAKKDQILQDMGIKLIRISSKKTWSQEEFNCYFDETLKEITKVDLEQKIEYATQNS